MLKFLIIIVIIFFIFFTNNIKEPFVSYNKKNTYYTSSCKNIFKEIEQIKNYIINNPIGHVYKKDIKMLLSALYDRDYRKYFYYILDKDSAILHSINTNENELTDGDVILVPNKGQMTVKIYDKQLNPHLSSRHSIIYLDSFIDPHVHPYYANKNIF